MVVNNLRASPPSYMLPRYRLVAVFLIFIYFYSRLSHSKAIKNVGLVRELNRTGPVETEGVRELNSR